MAVFPNVGVAATVEAVPKVGAEVAIAPKLDVVAVDPKLVVNEDPKAGAEVTVVPNAGVVVGAALRLATVDCAEPKPPTLLVVPKLCVLVGVPKRVEAVVVLVFVVLPNNPPPVPNEGAFWAPNNPPVELLGVVPNKPVEAG